MKRKTVFITTLYARLLSTLAIFAILSIVGVSCSDMYDNIKNFSEEEIVYPAHFDTIFATPGYNRIEIDLRQEGRVPSSRMNLGKATKTILEYDTVSIEYDSVCSWLNVTGLTLPKLYRFKVYTADKYGDRSVPMEVALTPFTSVDREALAAPSPSISTFANFIMVRWDPDVLTSSLMEYVSLSYSYTDKDGEIRTGTTRNTQFFVNNTGDDEEVEVELEFRVIPRLNGANILDTIDFKQTIEVSKAAGSDPIEFTVSPTRVGLIVGRAQPVTASILYGLTWTTSNSEVATVNANGVITGRGAGTAVITAYSEAVNDAAEISVTVVDASNIPAKEQLTGMWTFEYPNELERASVGIDSKIVGIGNRITSIAGPGNTKAVSIGFNAYYAVKHNIRANGGSNDRVNEYTIMFDIQSPVGAPDYLCVMNTKGDNLGDGVLWINKDRAIGYDQLGGYSTFGMQPGQWYRVVIAAKLGEALRVYIDGTQVWYASNNFELDGLMSLITSEFYIGPDKAGNGYPCPNYAEIRTWSVRLTDAQIKELGAVGN